ncbi:MAG: glutamate racemase [Chlamydiales bacterium]
MSTSLSPIGMFDSGVGGLTVMREVMRALPNESIIYMGDTARIPYGNKSPDTIIRYSLENTSFLLNHKIKLLIVACYTASSSALESIRQHFGIPVIGVIEPGAEKAASITKNQRIGVLGTRATIQSKAYQANLFRLLPQSKVISIACPLFVHLVEESFASHSATRLIIQEYLKSLQGEQIDTLLLGCTHYPFLRDQIQQEVGPNVSLVDSGQSCAEAVSSLLKQHQMEAPPTQQATYDFFVSDDPLKFRELGERLFGMRLPSVKQIIPA